MTCKICGHKIESWQGRHNDVHSACENKEKPAQKPQERPDGRPDTRDRRKFPQDKDAER